MRTVVFILFVFLILTPGLLSADVKEYLLDNGLKVLVVEDHKAPLATFQIWHRVGSRDEPAGKTGISHLLEHMMFKGTPKYGSKVFSNIIQRNGGSDNAHTTKDYTMYHQSLASDRIGLSIELESDRMTNLLLDAKDVVAERSVVLEERRSRYEDDPQNSLYEQVIATALLANQYRWPIIGWRSDIALIERDDLLRHYRTYYTPENAFIVVAGDVRPDEIIDRIKKAFGSIPRSNRQITRVSTREPEQHGQRRIMLKREAELPYILIAYPIPNFPHADSFALEVLSVILSEGKSSRLYRSLIYEKKIALSAWADYSGLYLDPFLFMFGATAAPSSSPEEVEKALCSEVERIKTELPSEREIEKAKNQIEASFVFAQDSNYSKALYTGLFEMMGDWRLMDTFLKGIRKVNAQDVQAVAKRYLLDDSKTVGVLIPVKQGR